MGLTPRGCASRLQVRLGLEAFVGNLTKAAGEASSGVQVVGPGWGRRGRFKLGFRSRAERSWCRPDFSGVGRGPRKSVVLLEFLTQSDKARPLLLARKTLADSKPLSFRPGVHLKQAGLSQVRNLLACSLSWGSRLLCWQTSESHAESLRLSYICY